MVPLPDGVLCPGPGFHGRIGMQVAAFELNLLRCFVIGAHVGMAIALTPTTARFGLRNYDQGPSHTYKLGSP